VLLTLGQIRCFADEGDPLADAFLATCEFKLSTFCLFTRTQYSLQDSSLQKFAADDPNTHNLGTDDLKWSWDLMPSLPGEEEPLTLERLQAIGETAKGALWVSQYLPHFRRLKMADWRAGLRALQENPLNLAREDVLFTRADTLAVHPTTGQPFTIEQMQQVAQTPRGMQWAPDYIATRLKQSQEPPPKKASSEETKSAEGTGAFKPKDANDEGSGAPRRLFSNTTSSGDDLMRSDQQDRHVASESGNIDSAASSVAAIALVTPGQPS